MADKGWNPTQPQTKTVDSHDLNKSDDTDGNPSGHKIVTTTLPKKGSAG